MVRTAAKGMSRCRGRRPPHVAAQEASTRPRSHSATSGARGGQPSTPAMPLNDSSQGAPPSAAARAASDLGPAGCKHRVARQVSQRLYRLYREVTFSNYISAYAPTHTTSSLTKLSQTLGYPVSTSLKLTIRPKLWCDTIQLNTEQP